MRCVKFSLVFAHLLLGKIKKKKMHFTQFIQSKQKLSIISKITHWNNLANETCQHFKYQFLIVSFLATVCPSEFHLLLWIPNVTFIIRYSIKTRNQIKWKKNDIRMKFVYFKERNKNIMIEINNFSLNYSHFFFILLIQRLLKNLQWHALLIIIPEIIMFR